jgi:hypothetical protein
MLLALESDVHKDNDDIQETIMKRKWLGILVFISLIGGFASCFEPFGYGRYSDDYGYYSGGYGYYPGGYGYYSRDYGYYSRGYGYRHGRNYYSNRGYERRDRGHAYYRSYTSPSRSARRTSDRSRTRW